jgi:serine protease
MPTSRRPISLTAALLVLALGVALAPASASATDLGAQIIVRSAGGQRALRSAVGDAGARVVGRAPDHGLLVQARDDTTIDGTIAALRRAHAVASAQPRLVARVADDQPDDTGLASRSAAAAGGWVNAQWDLTSPFGIDAPAAWPLARAAGRTPGAGVTVAVLDTGLAYANRPPFRRSPDISRNHVVAGRDFVANDPYPNDRHGHGTFVASTIIATPNNRYGMVGIAYGAKVMPVRVLDGNGAGRAGPIARGMRWAVDHGANVINVSIELVDQISGAPQSMTVDPLIREAVRYAAAHNVLVVAAAGNSASPDVPSTRLGSDILYVGGSTEHGCLGEYSNFGKGVDLVAPGGGADAQISGDPHCTPEASRGRNVEQVSFKRPSVGVFQIIRDRSGRPGLSGTSMAAPHATAAVALLLSSGVLGAHPTPGAIQARLRATARGLGPGAKPRYYGAGLLDAAAALRGTKTPPSSSSG